jgi:hypothetical protein
MTTATYQAAAHVSRQLETQWDFAYLPTHRELEMLYETAKKNQWNASTAIDWTRAVGSRGILNVADTLQCGCCDIGEHLRDADKAALEVCVSAWRLSQFLHGEQGALMVAAQLVNTIPDLDGKLYAATQVMDEGRHVEVFARYISKVHRIYPVDPVVKGLVDDILASDLWELKLLGMQMLLEGLAIASFNLMRRQTGDPTLADVLDYVLQDEGRHVNFGYFSLKRSLPDMDVACREKLEDFAFGACERLYARNEETGFRSIRAVWEELGWDGDQIWRDTIYKAQALNGFHRLLFVDVLIPRLRRLGLVSPRIEPRYRDIGLID